ncbi:MAG: hypothetical protein CBD74_12645 [Saprospirales bacterium TMED214]|nr:MAG: hypothetical protein CBD74_12645 [Saprospirales bacterium TMED214]
MSTSTRGNMAPFSFPDPNVQSTVTNPITGDVWQFVDGVWMISDPNDPDGGVSEAPELTESQEIIQLRIEIQNLRNDIIDLKAELTSASVNNFLILE